MQVQFWGTRGSIPKPGPATIRYGGNTLCVEVRTARGTLVIIDCGTGLHGLGLKLMSGGAKGLSGHILISHTHWDHIQGVPFFVPFFVPGTKWDIYGPKGLNQSLRETLAGQMQHTYFPVTTDEFGATLRYHDLVEGTFEIDDVKVTTQYLNHPALTLGYRLEADGVTLVYCCDHEPFSRAFAEGHGEFSGLDQRHADFVRGADLLIHDAQYTAAEYPSKVGWGHSTGEFVVNLAKRADVKHVVLAHHDPLRNDDAVERIVEKLRADLSLDGSPLQVSAAAEGKLITLERSGPEPEHATGREFSALTPLEAALVQRSILISVTDPKIAAALTGAAQAEGLRTNFCASAEAARAIIARDPPSLAIIDRDAARPDSQGVCAAIRSVEDDGLPIVVVAGDEDHADGVKDWLITPFTDSYARTKMRAWVLREACRWARAPIPKDEERRLTLTRALIDSQPEPQLDRITRLATALFNVPMATITLIDEKRQWFKSRHGVAAQENPRDVSFCAHVVYLREPMVVTDAFLDDRFADNPLVRGEPRIRFYAGYPLECGDGTCIGTLCLLDTRPRAMSEDQLDRLRDLAHIATDEIRAMEVKRARSA
ncbi:MBL fold metallo-hydrolase [Bradyrhizobium sp.]|uniref:MBL fold metallo-hydrolase n=1 Tax=Bradyrhizobium sp. TaxID=376 RepID=UPI0039E71868